MKFLTLTLLTLLGACNSQEVELGRIEPIEYFLSQMGAETAATTGGDYTSIDQCYAMTVDKDLNTICAGWTTGDFAEPRSTGSDPLIVKFDPEGNFLWARQLGSVSVAPGGSNTGNDLCVSVTTDDAGNIYCGGETTGTPSGAAFQGGNTDALVIKLAPDGGLIWVKTIGTDQADRVRAMTVKGNSLYVAGETRGELVIGERPVFNNDDAFIIKANLDGIIEWKSQLGEATLALFGKTAPGDDEEVNTVKVDSQGSVYIVGATKSNLMETRGGTMDPYIWKLRSTGGTKSIKHFGQTTLPNTSHDKFIGLAIDTNDDIYINGQTDGSLVETWSSQNGGWRDLFVFKMNNQLDVVWKKQLGTTTQLPGGNNSWDDQTQGIAVNKYGVYSLVATNGPYVEAQSLGFDFDTAVIKMNKANGSLISGVQVGAVTTPAGQSSLGADSPRSIHVDSRDRIYVGGSTLASLGETRVGAGVDIFVFKLDTNLKFSTAE